MANDQESLGGIAFIGNTLGTIFYHDPSDEEAQATYAALKELDVDAAADEWPYVASADAKEALQMIVDGLKASDPDGILWEYRRLFVGPAMKAAPPWGSVYTDRETVIFGNATLDLRQWMREAGIDNLNDEKEPEDHIGLMLMMMAWISQNKPELLDQFLQEHLLTWSDHFLEIVQNETDHPFFEGLAKITRRSLDGIQSDRGIQVEYPRYYR